MKKAIQELERAAAALQQGTSDSKVCSAVLQALRAADQRLDRIESSMADVLRRLQGG